MVHQFASCFPLIREPRKHLSNKGQKCVPIFLFEWNSVFQASRWDQITMAEFVLNEVRIPDIDVR